jgi:hypothetical protein
MRDRHRLSKFCLRHCLLLPGRSWCVRRRAWLAEQSFEHPARQRAFETYRHTVDLVDARIAANGDRDSPDRPLLAAVGQITRPRSALDVCSLHIRNRTPSDRG